MSHYNPDGVNRIVRVIDLDKPVPGDTDAVKHAAESMLTAFAHRNDAVDPEHYIEPPPWFDACGLDLDNSDMWIPDVACLGGVVCYAGDDLDSIVALQFRRNDPDGTTFAANSVRDDRSSVVAIVVQDVACD